MKHFFGLVLLVFFVQQSFAQSKYEKMRAFKTAYISEKLELTPEEAEKFWPVYNESEKRIRELRKENKKIVYASKNEAQGTDKPEERDAEKTLGQLLANDREMQKLKAGMFKDLKSVLSEDKLLKLYLVEAEFNKHLLNEYRKRGGRKP